MLACFHMMIPHLMPELPAAQREALAQNVKTPIVYTNVLVRNWRPWVELKVSDISAPMSFHSRVALDFPVSLGGYRHPRDPGEPMCLHLVHVAGAPNQGLTARQQFKIGQAKLLQMPFSEFEARIRDELDRMLGARRIFERPRHRRNHRQPLAARLRLCGEFAVRRRRL